jgi:hypothetical protein
LSQTVFPAPAVVVGVGRFGLAVLEQLGESWMGLRLAGADASRKNLRLLAVRPENEGSEERWCEHEKGVVAVANYLGEGDLPSLALDFALLRSLGLIRYQDGCYQVALPRDAGVVEVPAVEAPAPQAEDVEAPVLPAGVYRRRYFEWLRLSPDPIIAAERLRHLTQRLQDLDLFVTPLLNRVRQGHSPGALLACIGRFHALKEGRDPAPWGWFRKKLNGRGPAAGPGAPGESPPALRIALDLLLWADEDSDEKTLNKTVRTAQDVERYLLGLPEPIPEWRSWLAVQRREEEEPGVGDLAAGDRVPGRPELAIEIPAPFLPNPGDPVAPFEADRLLRRDWESTGWASEGDGHSPVTFRTLETSPFRQGLFDHDGRDFRPPEQEQQLASRLELLGQHLHRGLVRLWVDLQRERSADVDLNVMVQARNRDYLTDALQQSLEILGELLVRPLAPIPTAGTSPLPPVPPRQRSDAETELPLAPSRLLSGLLVDESEGEASALQLLTRRLARLGLDEPEELSRRTATLLADIPLDLIARSQGTPAAEGELGSESAEPRAAGQAEADPVRVAGLRQLRAALNRQVRDLLGFNFLAEYRKRPTRRPPRLTVFVIGDMSEPFVRETIRPVLREVHAELLRAFTPIFESYREGFDRCLAVTPILWTPHPADPFPGQELDLNRCEEAAIIDSVHGIRRWVESVLSPGRRFISQIFVNSRVTDTSALSLQDAARQTRDFLSFQIRNDLGSDPWLRQTAVGVGNDLFASFSCYEIDFPALRCREYLANLLARECLAAMKEGEEVRLEDPEPFEPPEVQELRQAGEKLSAITREAADHMAARVSGRIVPEPMTPATEILAKFGEEFEHSLLRQVQERWNELTGRQGQVDDMVDALRIRTSNLLSRQLDRVRAHSDRLIEEYAGTGGLKAAQAGFHKLRTATRDTFQKQEELRRRKEALSLKHTLPDLASVSHRRQQVVRAAERKPDRDPMSFGLVLWVLLGPVLGAPLAHSLAYWLDLHRSTNALEYLLGPAGWVVGTLLLALPAWALLRWHMRLRVHAVRSAIDEMAAAVRRLLWGTGLPPDKESGASIRSFLESRLELTAAVATRGYALRILERAVADSKLAYRLARSVDVQAQTLARRSEDLGVRSRMPDGTERREDLRNLFDSRSGGAADRLIEPDDLHRYYDNRTGGRDELPQHIRELIQAAGGFADWRERACLADSEKILAYCRIQFEGLVNEPISDQHFFAERVSRRLVEFVVRCYSNLGFGAGFKGYEGLDPDNVQILADASLVVHRELAQLFEKARSILREEFATTETMQVQQAQIRPNAAYMMSLVKGIRVHSMRNLRRFESFHHRIKLPDDRIFPLSHEQQGIGAPINPLTGYQELARRLSEGIRTKPVETEPV